MIDFVVRHVLPAAYALLPAKMNSPEATAMVLAAGLQETRFLERRQRRGGPGRSFWQYEPGSLSALAGVLHHRQTAAYAAQVLEQLRYPRPVLESDYLHMLCNATEHNDILGAAFARLLLWTLPVPLPKREQPRQAWAQYLDAWRPGEPHPETWDAMYTEAWERLDLSLTKEFSNGNGYSHRSLAPEGHPPRRGDSRGRAPRRSPYPALETRGHRPLG